MMPDKKAPNDKKAINTVEMPAMGVIEDDQGRHIKKAQSTTAATPNPKVAADALWIVPQSCTPGGHESYHTLTVVPTEQKVMPKPHQHGATMAFDQRMY
mmetsp:Transcript_8419/g.13754  ORF Transcript_8419/g.13754 Transcript_8419/m.13754 type:complete len:99 (-) Transcript_8419:279-575(-)